MSTPSSAHQDARRRAQLIVEREYRPDPARCVAAIVKLLTYRPADPSAGNDSADHRRPLRAGARPLTHDALASRPRDNEGAEEVNHREPLTTIDG